jgi:hypothetical protein
MKRRKGLRFRIASVVPGSPLDQKKFERFLLIGIVIAIVAFVWILGILSPVIVSIVQFLLVSRPLQISSISLFIIALLFFGHLLLDLFMLAFFMSFRDILRKVTVKLPRRTRGGETR